MPCFVVPFSSLSLPKYLSHYFFVSLLFLFFFHTASSFFFSFRDGAELHVIDGKAADTNGDGVIDALDKNFNASNGMTLPLYTLVCVVCVCVCGGGGLLLPLQSI